MDCEINMGKAKNKPRGDAGTDKAIAGRLKRHPEDVDARLDAALDESMDASDPPALTRARGPRDSSKAPDADTKR
ncbi:hypothetical protein [Sphingomonas cavernae]|uniref:hypothetical protein n=1 Tax=Sphingomonas cavernae TaxID=2320861 RepID=UPI0011C43349|nr:hypothetical protein [Sphingomonas cavernae]